MAHFDGSAELVGILLCILVLYLVLVGVFILAGHFGHGPGRMSRRDRRDRKPGRRVGGKASPESDSRPLP